MNGVSFHRHGSLVSRASDKSKSWAFSIGCLGTDELWHLPAHGVETGVGIPCNSCERRVNTVTRRSSDAIESFLIQGQAPRKPHPRQGTLRSVGTVEPQLNLGTPCSGWIFMLVGVAEANRLKNLETSWGPERESGRSPQGGEVRFNRRRWGLREQKKKREPDPEIDETEMPDPLIAREKAAPICERSL